MRNDEQLIQHTAAELKEMKKKSFFYSMIRICLMLLVFLFLYLGGKQTVLYGFSVIFTLLFLCMVKLHEALKKKNEFKEELLEVIAHLKRRTNDEWKKEETVSIAGYEDDTLSYDLDLVGRGSLFQYLNMAHTPYGKEHVAKLLTHAANDVEEAIRRQNAVKELLQKPDFLLFSHTHSALFEKHSKKVKRAEFDNMTAYAKQEEHVNTVQKGISTFLRAVTIVAAVLVIFQVLPYPYLLGFAVLNIAVTLLSFSSINEALTQLQNLKSIVEDYQELIQEISKENFQDPFLFSIKSKLEEAKEGIHQLLNISMMVQFRGNFITFALFNGLFLLDFLSHTALIRWKQHYGDQMEHWFETIALFEGLCSLCVIKEVKQDCCFPNFSEETCYMDMKQVQHPLIMEQKAVANSMKLENGTYIITGSNMSGKTTFLRTIGINLMLAMCGAPVCAASFTTSFLRIYTSMRVKDDVNEGISTFYAELLRIKHMMQASKHQEGMLVLIDEIFKGTNSADRVLCAKEAIAKLHLPHVITMVSTHDFELCELEKDTQIQAHNYHFEEFYEGDNISFDYLLKQGKCTTTNAKELMRLAGILS